MDEPEDIYSIQLILQYDYIDSRGIIREGHPYLVMKTPLCFTSFESAKAALNDIEEWVKDYAKVTKEGK